MTRWIKTLYSNQSIIDYRRLHLGWVVLLLLLNNLLITLPYMVSIYSISSRDIVESLPGLEDDLLDFLDLYPSCRLSDQLVCDESDQLSQGSVYEFVLLPSKSNELKPYQVRFEPSTFTLTDAKGEALISGLYPNLGDMSFKDFQHQLLNFEEGSSVFLGNYLRSVILSFFTERMFLQFLLILIQNSIYVLVLSFLFLFISTLKPRPFNYFESLSMITQAMFAPALFTALLGFYFPDLATVGFTLLLIVRIIWLYQGILGKRLHFGEM